MKRFLPLLLAFILCFGFTACGAGTDENQPEDQFAFTFDIESDTAAASEKALIRAVNLANGETLWTYETESIPVAELEALQEIGLCVNGYMFIAGGTVYCLNPLTGETEWANDEFGGAGASWTFDDEGCIYLCGYYGPELMVIDSVGETKYFYPTFAEYDEFTEGCFWASEINIDDEGHAFISYDNNGKTVEVTVENGEVVDVLSWSTPIYAQQLCGMWTNDVYSQDIVIDIADDMSYTIFYNGCKYYGYVELMCYNEARYDEPDSFALMLNETDDPAFSGWNSLGDYLIQVIDGNGSDMWLNLCQMNNGDSIFSIYFDEMAPILYKIDAVG